MSPLERENAELKRRLQAAERERDRKYQSITKAVFETVRDSAATWDTACDELIWGVYDSEGPEHQPVTDAHLNECCARFPQWASELRPFAARWNEPDERLTDEGMAAMEVSPEEVSRSTRSALRILHWADKIRAAESALLQAREDAQRYRYLRKEGVALGNGAWLPLLRNERLDSYVDAARQAEPLEGEKG